MKYIRTKDNIFEIENNFPHSIIFCKPKNTQMLVAINDNEYEMRNIVIKKEIGKDHWNEEIVAKANTIEELCDEFVLVAPYRFRRPKTTTELEKDFEEMKYFYTDKDDTIYGAIWTDRGLIYVAKMNEKGELELL